MSSELTVCAVVIRNDAERVITVRKRGTHRLMLPGGKPEAGESAKQTAIREVAEELQIKLRDEDLHLLGEFTAPAANEAGLTVRATVFEHPAIEAPSPDAEIEYLEWIDPAAETPNLAPLLRDVIFPLLRSRNGNVTSAKDQTSRRQ